MKVWLNWFTLSAMFPKPRLNANPSNSGQVGLTCHFLYNSTSSIFFPQQIEITLRIYLLLYKILDLLNFSHRKSYWRDRPSLKSTHLG